MKAKSIFFACLITAHFGKVVSQTIPSFGPEKRVNVIGLSFDAMEPFLSPDGTILFFNSLNSGGNTNLYYASMVNDTTFIFEGLVNGTYDPSPNHLDAVPSMDSLNNFFWVSTRNYPTQMENLHMGTFWAGDVSNIKRVYGNMYNYTFNYPFGWLIMDAAINHQGDQLYYCNAWFDFSQSTCGQMPCEATLGIAQKTNDSTFSKLLNSDALLSQVNDTNYLVYAPHLSKNGRELYYTRLEKGTFNTEICVAVRNSLSDAFGVPTLIHSNNGFVPEAPTLSSDMRLLYYHQKDASNRYRLFLRYNNAFTGVEDAGPKKPLEIYPNPAAKFLHIDFPAANESYQLIIYSTQGKNAMSIPFKTQVDVSGLSPGTYYLSIYDKDRLLGAKMFSKP